MRVNFLEKKKPLIKNKLDVLFGIFILLSLIGYHVIFLNSVNAQISLLQEKIAFLNKEIKANREIKAKLKELRRTEAEISRRNALLRKLKERKSVPQIALYFAEKGTPKGVWLTDLEVNSKETTIKGGALDVNGIIKLLGSIDKLGTFSLEEITKDVAVFKNLNKEVPYYKYTLTR